MSRECVFLSLLPLVTTQTAGVPEQLTLEVILVDHDVLVPLQMDRCGERGGESDVRGGL